MNNNISIIKGVHPGFILERELQRRNLKKGQFALSLHEFPQTLVSITKGKRRMNTALAMKIEKALGLEEGYFMILQVYHDIEQEKLKLDTATPDLSKLRKGIFWDTDINTIKWEKHKKGVIQRVFERGNETEKAEITRFYGEEVVNEILKNVKKAILPYRFADAIERVENTHGL
jgi:antitoxin HigA-1